MRFKEKIHTTRAQGLGKETLWEVWTDVNQWHTWDMDIEWAKLNQPFQTGSHFFLKPKGGPKVRITLEDVKPLHSFTDRASFPFAKMYSTHNLKQIEGVLEFSHAIRLEGFLSCLWWHLIAKNIAAGLEAQAERLVERARKIEKKVKK